MSNNIEAYLEQLLTEIKPYNSTAEESKKIERNKVAFVADKICRKEYRKRALVESTRNAIYEKVKLSVDRNDPVHFVIPFGGYKHFWNPSHPEPDWAELFNFRYLTDFVLPVLAVYDPGVVIEYISEDLILPLMNNYPIGALDRYSEVFRQILKWYSQYVNKNLTFNYFRVSERCDKDKIIQQVNKLIPGKRSWFEKLSKEDKEIELHRSNRSVYWNGLKDLSNLTEQQRAERVIESRLIELSYYETESQPEFLGNYLGEDNHICIDFSFGTTHDNDEYQDLTLGSTYGSIVDHWIGRGILEKRSEKFVPKIVSKNQYIDMKDNLKVYSIHDILPFKNYQEIEVLEQ